ncbi:MAG TPA: hypothetical protein DD670_07515 [Planctomycetaceae bacterium]|nr:hypothetical protein [Planctomycetaceae bacterium]
MLHFPVRCVPVSVILLLGLCVRAATCDEQDHPDPATCQEQDRRDDTISLLLEELENPQRILPSGTIIAANVVGNGRWYVVGATEIAAVRAILKQAKRPDDYFFTPPFPLLPDYTIVLWGVVDGKVVPLRAIWIRRSVSYFHVLGKGGGNYLVPDGKQRETLRTLIRRIEEGKEEPVATRRDSSQEAEESQKAEAKK